MSRSLKKSIIPATNWVRAREPGTGTGSLGWSASNPPTPKLTGNRALWPAMEIILPNSVACEKNWASPHVGCTRSCDCDIACDWNNGPTMCEFDRPTGTLCFRACLISFYGSTSCACTGPFAGRHVGTGGSYTATMGCRPALILSSVPSSVLQVPTIFGPTRQQVQLPSQAVLARGDCMYRVLKDMCKLYFCTPDLHAGQ